MLNRRYRFPLVPLLFLGVLSFGLQKEGFAFTAQGKTVLKFNYQPAKNNLEDFTQKELEKILPQLSAVQSFECNSTGCSVNLKPFLVDLEISVGSPFVMAELGRVLGLRPFNRYSTATLLNAPQRVLFFLKNRGFLSAGATADLFVSKKGFASLKLKVDRGKPFFWGGFKFENACFSTLEFYREFNKPLGKPFSYIDLYNAMDLAERLCFEKTFKRVYVYYLEPFDVKKGQLITYLWKNFSIKPPLGFDFLSQYVNFLVESPVEGIKFLYKPADVVIPVLEIRALPGIRIEIKGVKKLPNSVLAKYLSTKNFLKEPQKLKNDLENIYKSYGFLDARVELKVEKNRYLFRVHEGKRYKVRFHLEPPSLFEIVLPRGGYFTGNETRRVLSYLEEKLKENNILYSKIDVVEKVDRKEKVVDITFVVEKPVRFRCKFVKRFDFPVRGLKDSAEMFLRRLNCSQAVYNPDILNTWRDELEKILQNYGCYKPQVSVELRKSDREPLYLVVWKASCKTFKKFDRTAYWVEGRIPKREIEYLIPRLEGKRYNPKLWDVLNTRFVKSDLFRSYTFKKISIGKRIIPLVEAVERRPFNIGASLGYTTDEGFLAQGDIKLYDLLRMGERIALSVYYSQKRNTYSLTYLDNYFFSRRFLFTAGVFKKYENHRDFDLNAKGYSLGVGIHLSYFTDAVLNYIYDTYSVSPYFPPPSGSLKKVNINVQTVYPIYRGVVKKGKLLMFLSFSKALNLTRYKKFEAKGGASYTLDGVYADFKAAFGAVDDKAPVFEKFFLGGLNNLKAYPYESVAPYGGGNYYWYTGFELGIPVWGGNLYLFSGFDAGNAAKTVKNLKQNVKSDLFIGLGTVTSLGPIRGGFAIPYENQRFKLKDGKFFLLIGFQF